jgi:phosphate starvation-inducible PhoH-like protein
MQGDRLASEHKIRFFENGAAQPYNARVLTPAGWTRMQDITTGDYVTGPDGKPRRVLGVYPQGEKDIYRVTFSGGATAECCEDHLWRVASIYDRKLGRCRVVTLREIIDAGIRYASGPAKWSCC